MISDSKIHALDNPSKFHYTHKIFVSDEERNYFETPDIIETEAKFDAYLSAFGESSFKRNVTRDQLEIPTTPYKVRHFFILFNRHGLRGRAFRN